MVCLLSRRSVVAGALATTLVPGIPAAARPDPRVLLSDIGFEADALREIARGRVVAVERTSTFETELSGAAAMWVHASPGELAGRLRSGLIVLADRDVTAWAAIEPADAGEGGRGGRPGRSSAGSWSAVSYRADERSEIERFYAAEPGGTFNLSVDELASLRARLAGGSAEDAGAPAAISDAYRDILAGRCAAYRAGGAAGLAPYARADGYSSPAEDLRRIDMAGRVPPALRPAVGALDRFPVLPPGVDSRFYWKKSVVDDRPIFVLSHVLVEERDDGVLFALREYYPGHSYNVLQQVGSATSTSDGSLVLAVNSTVTDRVKGLFGPLARAIGRRQALSALREYFAQMRLRLDSTDARGTATAGRER